MKYPAFKQTKRWSWRSVWTFVLTVWVLPIPRVIIAQEMEHLLGRTAVVRTMDETELSSIVPIQSGLYFIGCPNCNSGRQEGQLIWTIDRPNEVTGEVS